MSLSHIYNNLRRTILLKLAPQARRMHSLPQPGLYARLVAACDSNNMAQLQTLRHCTHLAGLSTSESQPACALSALPAITCGHIMMVLAAVNYT